MQSRTASLSHSINVCFVAGPLQLRFFDREIEQSFLLTQLKQNPTNVLLIVGPRSSGKSQMLHEVLLGKQHKALVAFVNGRSQRLTDAAIMASALRKEGARQLP